MNRMPQIEILRIIGMGMILILHSLGHGGVLSSFEAGTIGYAIFWFIEALCYVAVNEFVLITGYFGPKSRFKLSKVVSLWVEVLYFSIICTSIVFINSRASFDNSNWIYAFFPLTSKRYWYASVYLLLLIFRPALNKIIENSSKSSFLQLIISLLLMYSIAPSIFPWAKELAGSGMDIMWFVILYLIGGYISKYGIHLDLSKSLVLYFCFSVALFLILVITNKNLYYYNSLFVLGASISLFLVFSKINIKRESALIYYLSRIGSYVFGAYLISDHRVIRSLLWEKADIINRCNNNVLRVIAYITIVNGCIMVIGVALDWLIKRVLSLPSVKKGFVVIDEKYNQIWSVLGR